MINVFAVCRKGYNGIHCEKPCVFPHYGFDCQSQCNCAKLYCHFAHGCNQTSEIGILIYYYLNIIYTICLLHNICWLLCNNFNIIRYTMYYYLTYNTINVTVTLFLYRILQHYFKMYNDYVKHIKRIMWQKTLWLNTSLCAKHYFRHEPIDMDFEFD